ncbi:hypothetical protein JTB14_024671 [Gonioctena quinquepunctata]|nr:hypothetical protein JTB14_024671 [Gonioctena quinquepunctata]
MPKRCRDPKGAPIPPIQPHIPRLDGTKRKTKEGRSRGGSRPHDQPPCPTKTPVPHSPWLCHPLCHPAAVFEIADIPLPPPRTTTKLPSPAPAPSDAPSSPLSDPAPPGKPDESWTPDHIIRALQNGERSPELTEALQKLRPPHRPTGRLRYQLRASDGTSMKILLPPCP